MELPKSSYNGYVLDLVDNYCPKPLIRTIGHPKHGILREFDMSKSYSLGIYQQDEDEVIPVCSVYDNRERWVGEQPTENVGCGLYLLEHFEYGTGKKVLKVDRNFYTHNFVNYLIKKGVSFKIEEFVRCYNSIPVKFFKKFVGEVFRVIYSKHNGDAKMVVNSFLGSFGTKYHKKENTFLTNDFNVQCYAISMGYTLEEFEYTEDGIVKQMTMCSDRCRIQIRKRLSTNLH